MDEGRAEHGLDAKNARSHSRQFCGMRRRLALSVAALALLLIAGALAGGIVGGLEAKNQDESNSNDPVTTSGLATKTPSLPTTSTSTSTHFPTPSSGILPLNCPAINNTQYTIGYQTFYLYCAVDIKSSAGDVAQSLQPSLSDCIQACVDYSNDTSHSRCQAITFIANFTR